MQNKTKIIAHPQELVYLLNRKDQGSLLAPLLQGQTGVVDGPLVDGAREGLLNPVLDLVDAVGLDAAQHVEEADDETFNVFQGVLVRLQVGMNLLLHLHRERKKHRGERTRERDRKKERETETDG